ncbi:hypothetical protein [Natronomonas sp. EA1]|uniref:DUF7858 family protein n=1 Tax=Natronomonas sp. EA1 TaxID=3421655 RepID=UPI003EBE000A
MTLDDIAAGLEVTTRQRDRGVAAVDDTDAPLATRLADHELPCSPEAAAALVEAYADGRSVGDAARVGGVAPATAAKTLHLLGESVNPLSPTARAIVRDWLDADLSRADALALTGANEREFALAVFCETHDPIPGACDAVEGALTVRPVDPLADARSDLGELL